MPSYPALHVVRQSSVYILQPVHVLAWHSHLISFNFIAPILFDELQSFNLLVMQFSPSSYVFPFHP
jgi:hypothetical protein